MELRNKFGNGSEDSTQALIAKGCLRGDDIARALVPMLLKKADRKFRGCVVRTGSSAASSDAQVGLVQLGFALGGILGNAKVQQAFGIGRALAKPPSCLITPWTPNFFIAEGRQLQESIASGLGMLNLLKSNAYMIIRDETVFSRSWNLLYGLSNPPSI